MENTQTIEKRAARFSAGTLLSRITGMLREVVTAALLGANASIAAFMVSYRLSHTFRRLLGEGGLMYGFIPSLQKIREGSEEEGKQFFRDLTGTLAFLLLALIVICEGILLGVSQVVSPVNYEVVKLAMVMLPGLFFVVMGALFGSLLQCEGKYFLTGVSPSIINVLWIASVFFAARFPIEKGVVILGWGTVGAFAAQAVLLAPTPLRWLRTGKLRLFAPQLKVLVQALTFSVIGVAATQLNNFIDLLFARSASLEGPAYLAYAIRLELFPLALVPIALSSALLPTLSKEGSDQAGLITHSLRRVFLLIFPCTVAIFALGDVVVNAIYGHGAFTAGAVGETTSALQGYGIGLVPMSFVIILSQYYYAKRDYITPMRASLISVGVNLCLNALFIFGFGWGSVSVAYATSVASLVNVAFLVRPLEIKYRTFAKMTLAALFSGWGIYVSRKFFLCGISRAVVRQMGELFCLGGTFGVLYFSCLWKELSVMSRSK